jgi:DNA-binding transcriptional MocR family regulator
MRGSDIREVLTRLRGDDAISFAGGMPDPALLPVEAMREAHAAILGDPRLAATALQYSATAGHEPLRHWIAGHMARLGVPCDLDNVVITAGAQQALDLLARLFIAPGRRVLVQVPTYLGAVQAFDAHEPVYEGPGQMALAYAVPDFANPTGETMPEAARGKLLDAARAADAPLIEDAAYQGLRFEGQPEPSCLSLDIRREGSIDHSRVIYCGSFSKVLAPGLRLGWICAARELVRKVVLAKQAADLHVPTLSQMVMHRVAERHHATQIARSVATYVRRRDAMLRALARHMPEGVVWTRPQGGMFVWVTLPSGMDVTELLAQALEAGVAFVPGRGFFTDGSGGNTLRLSYALPSESRIETGIARLGALVSRLATPRAALSAG